MSSQNPKSGRKILRAVNCKDYASATPATTDCISIDTRGFRWAQFVIVAGVMTVASGTLPLKIVESSDDFSSDAATDVTGATFTALDGNSDNSIHSVIVDCQKTERYLKIAGTSPTTSTVMLLAGICILSGAVDSVWIGTNGVDASVEAVAP